MKPPKVSINLCCYNSEKYLRETLDSIVNQTYKDWELVIINDGSTDSTEAIIKEYIDKGYPIIYHYQENHGLGYSRNEALKRSSGEFIAFIDHDDIWLPDKLEKQIPLFSDPEVGLVFSDAIVFSEKGEDASFYERMTYYEGNCFSRLLSDYFLVLSTVVIRYASLDDEQEWFDQRFNMIEEADLFRRISYRWKLRAINSPLSKYRVHESSLTNTKGFLEADETFLMLSKYEIIFKDFKEKYRKERIILEKKMLLAKAKLLISERCGYIKARNLLYPYMFYSWKILLFVILTFYPPLLKIILGKPQK